MVAGSVPAEWLVCPESEAAKTLLFLHGGAYVIGSLATHRDLASRLARAAGARAFSVGYRLAPEYPFPAAFEDALATYRFLLESGVAPESIAIAGDSAGAGLGLALLLEARRLGWPLPAAWVGLSPSVDLAGSGASFATNAASDPVIEHRFLLATAKLYLGDHDRRDPRASPLYGELSGLPPLFIQVGSPETLLDDSRLLAQRAKAAGTQVELEIWDGMFHGWHLYARILPEGSEAIERVGEWLRGRLRG